VTLIGTAYPVLCRIFQRIHYSTMSTVWVSTMD